MYNHHQVTLKILASFELESDAAAVFVVAAAVAAVRLAIVYW